MDEEPLPRLPASLDDRFQVTEVLGHGNYGCVYGVRPRGGGATRALKIISVEGDPRRALREIEAARRVIHPHLLRCHEAGLLGGSAYLLLERAEGTLADFLRRRSALGSVWRWILQAARGTGALHAAGLVHRDLKPSNILIIRGAACVADLGMVRSVEGSTLTGTGVVLGTPGYMAPEVALGEDPTPASDAFALGVMLYLALEGRIPFRGGDAGRLLMAAARGEVLPLARGREVLSPNAASLVEGALAVDPAERPRDLERWADLLEAERPELMPTGSRAGARGSGPSPRATRVVPRSDHLSRRIGRSTGRRVNAGRGGRSLLATAATLVGALAVAWTTTLPGKSAPEERPPAARRSKVSRDPVAGLEAAARAILAAPETRTLLAPPAFPPAPEGVDARSLARAAFARDTAQVALRETVGEVVTRPPAPGRLSPAAPLVALELLHHVDPRRHPRGLHPPLRGPALTRLARRALSIHPIPELDGPTQAVFQAGTTSFREAIDRWLEASTRTAVALVAPGPRAAATVFRDSAVLPALPLEIPPGEPDFLETSPGARTAPPGAAPLWTEGLPLASSPARDLAFLIAGLSLPWDTPLWLEVTGEAGPPLRLVVDPPPTRIAPNLTQARWTSAVLVFDAAALPPSPRRLRLTPVTLPGNAPNPARLFSLHQVVLRRPLPPPAMSPPPPDRLRDRLLTQLDVALEGEIGASVVSLPEAIHSDHTGGLAMDPARWPELRARLPALDEVESWLVRGGRPEDLSPATLREWMEVDESMGRRGLPRPLLALLDPEGLGPGGRPSGSFALAAAREMIVAWEFLDQLRHPLSPEDTAERREALRALDAAAEVFAELGLTSEQHEFHEARTPYSSHPQARRCVAVALGSSPAGHRLRYLVHRAVRDEPAQAEYLAWLLATRASTSVMPFAYGEAALRDPRGLLDLTGPARGPAALFAADLVGHWRVLADHYRLPRETSRLARELRIDLLRTAALERGGTGWPDEISRRRELAFLQLLRALSKAHELEELQRIWWETLPEVDPILDRAIYYRAALRPIRILGKNPGRVAPSSIPHLRGLAREVEAWLAAESRTARQQDVGTDLLTELGATLAAIQRNPR